MFAKVHVRIYVLLNEIVITMEHCIISSSRLPTRLASSTTGAYDVN